MGTLYGCIVYMHNVGVVSACHLTKAVVGPGRLTGGSQTSTFFLFPNQNKPARGVGRMVMKYEPANNTL